MSLRPPRRAPVALAAPAAVVLWLGMPMAAVGSEARIERTYFEGCKADCPDPGYREQLVYRADPGEANRVFVSSDGSGAVRLRDPAAVVRAGGGCTSVDDHELTCQSTTYYFHVFVFGGDGDDVVRASMSATADGGQGNDRLVGSQSADDLYGGPGEDQVLGAEGDDRLYDGELRKPAPRYDLGDAAVPPRPDRFDGGPGADVLSYQWRTRGVFVDLSRSDNHAGARGEGDAVDKIESVEGGGGADRLLGDEGANELTGHGGQDLVVGRGGADLIYVYDGDARVRAGGGDDYIRLDGEPRYRQRVACGSGRDRVSILTSRDFVTGDCEELGLQGASNMRSLLPLVFGRLPFVARGEFTCEGPCRGRLEVRVAHTPKVARRFKGALLGIRRVVLRSTGYSRKWGRVRLSRRGFRILRRHEKLLVRVRLVTSSALGGGASSYLTRLRAPVPHP